MVEDSPIVAALKRYALEQAAPPPPAPTASPVQAALSGMSAPMPNIQSPAPQVSLAGPQQMASNVPSIAAPQAPQVTPVQAQPGPIKSFLQQFVHGAGQGLLTHVGLENDAQRQARVFNQGIATQNANRQSDLTQAQIDSLSGKSEALNAQNQPIDTSTLGIPGLTGVVLQKDLPRVLIQHVRNQGNQGVADTRAKAATDVADTRAASLEAHDAVSSQVRRDIAAGQLGMAGARLHLAQQVAAAKQNGSYGAPTADRLRRGDLANNAQDNIATTIEDIQKNPNLFGKISGHYTTAQQMIGSDDPAIARIGVQIHNAALASNGAHGLRSAQAVADTEKELLNHFRNSPEATISGLNAMNSSLNTFIQDAAEGRHFTPRNPSAAPAATHRFNPTTGKIEAINAQ